MVYPKLFLPEQTKSISREFSLENFLLDNLRHFVRHSLFKMIRFCYLEGMIRFLLSRREAVEAFIALVYYVFIATLAPD